MKNFIKLILVSALLWSCNVQPEAIEYGKDACHFCNMTIVNRQYASQLVTSKGKVYKYDATECMIHSLESELQNTQIAMYLVSDFNEPGQLMDATSATYLVSDKISSPMGANLSSFKDEITAKDANKKFQGEIFSWKQIQTYLKQ